MTVLQSCGLMEFRVLRSRDSQHDTRGKSLHSSSTDTSRSFNSFIKNILPPPPDKRIVQMVHQAQAPEALSSTELVCSTAEVCQPKRPEISNLNTTLIGDYTATVFPEYSTHWLVQAFGNRHVQVNSGHGM